MISRHPIAAHRVRRIEAPVRYGRTDHFLFLASSFLECADHGNSNRNRAARQADFTPERLSAGRVTPFDRPAGVLSRLCTPAPARHGAGLSCRRLRPGLETQTVVTQRSHHAPRDEPPASLALATIDLSASTQGQPDLGFRFFTGAPRRCTSDTFRMDQRALRISKGDFDGNWQSYQEAQEVQEARSDQDTSQEVSQHSRNCLESGESAWQRKSRPRS